MAKGQTFPSEKRTFTDPETGHTVCQLTQAPGHDHHLYFTETSFLPDGTGACTRVVKHEGSFDMQIGHPHPVISPDDGWVLHTSDRGGHCNVYLAEL